MIVLEPSRLEDRWKQAHECDELIQWRSLAFLLSAEAKMADVYEQYATRNNLLFLFEIALQHVYRLQPVRSEA